MSLTDVIEGTRKAVDADPHNAAVSFSVANALKPGTRTEVEVKVRDHSFTVDEPPEKLGTTLSLPPWFQVRRDRLDETLPPIVVPTTATSGAH